MGARRHPDRAPGDEAGQLPEDARIGRGRAHVELEIAGDRDRRAEPGQPLRVGLALGEAQGEARQEGRRGLRHLLPAPRRALGEPGVDEHDRHAAPVELGEHVRPDLGFGEQDQVGPPMVEEAAHPPGHVDRQELVHRARRKAPAEKLGRGAGPGGQEQVQPPPGQALAEGKEGEGLADARPVQPHERPFGARRGGDAAPLAPPLRVLLAAPGAPEQERDGGRFEKSRSGPVEPEGRRQGAAHAARSRPSRRPSFAPGSCAPTRA